MKRIAFSFISILICSLCLAQSQFSNLVLNGDVKMRERFYEMALDYYNQAKSVASSGAEVMLVESKIAECERVLNPPKEEKPSETPGPKSRILFSDQYLETGTVYSFERDELIPSDDEEVFTIYNLEVRSDCLVIVSYLDRFNRLRLEDVPSGTIIPLVSETKDIRRFATGSDGEEFIVFKKSERNEYGHYHVVLRKEKNKYLRLYSNAEFRSWMTPVSEETVPSDDSVVSYVEATPEKFIPVSFTESWVLNLDSDGNRLGDSRSERLESKDIRWMTLRMRYYCPENFENSVRFDIKVVDPSGNLVIVPGKGTTQGFTTYFVLETIPGGGIFTVAIGDDNPGFFVSGKYSIGLWNGGINYYSTVIDLL